MNTETPLDLAVDLFRARIKENVLRNKTINSKTIEEINLFSKKIEEKGITIDFISEILEDSEIQQSLSQEDKNNLSILKIN